MAESRKKNRHSGANRLATFGVAIVVAFLAVTVMVSGSNLHARNQEYRAMEESLDAEIRSEEKISEELSEQKVYVKTKEYIIEKAREIFRLKMPDEIIVQPEN